MELHFAPMQGYADAPYRRLHNSIYGGIDCYYTPFIRMEHGQARHQDIARLKQCNDDAGHLVPQIIFNSIDEFKLLSDAVKECGYHEIDLNLGCPYPMQTGKGRGSAMIANLGVMESIARAINDDKDTSYSIKMRLGLDDPDQWQELMPIVNSIGLRHIAMHPRIAKQMYGGDVNMDQFKRFVECSRNPVVYNGDIKSLDDIHAIAKQFPDIKGVMIGRGLLARPSLAAEYRSGDVWQPQRRLAALQEFHTRLFDIYAATLCGPTQILQKIKPFWEYLQPEISHKAYKTIKKSTTLSKYTSAVKDAFLA